MTLNLTSCDLEVRGEEVGGGEGEVDSSRGNLNMSDEWCGGVRQGQWPGQGKGRAW